MHALVGDGKHGCAERIQMFRGPACRTPFSARRHTPLYRLKTPSHQIAKVLSALAEGPDASAAERVFGYRQATITSWLTRAGGHAEIFHERCFRNLHLPHLQLDEIRTRLRSCTQVLWLWLAIGLRKCTYHGQEGMERWIGLGIVASNLRHIGQVHVIKVAKKQVA
jgi:hypothetical protein